MKDSTVCVIYNRQTSTKAREMQSRLKDCFGVSISIPTVKRWRAELGWKFRTVSMDMLRNRERMSDVMYH